MSASENKWWCITSISTSTGWILLYLLCCFCPSTSGIFFSITLKSTSALSPAVIPSREIYWPCGCVYSTSWRKNLRLLLRKRPLLLPRCFIYFPSHWQVSLVGAIPCKTAAVPWRKQTLPVLVSKPLARSFRPAEGSPAALTQWPKEGAARRQLALMTETLWAKRFACPSPTLLLILAHSSDRCSGNEYRWLIYIEVDYIPAHSLTGARSTAPRCSSACVFVQERAKE